MQGHAILLNFKPWKPIMSERIIIKGTSAGVIITIGAGDWQIILNELSKKLDQKASFFKGGRVALQVGNRLLNQEEIEAVGTLIANHSMTLWAIESNAPQTQATTQSLGLETLQATNNNYSSRSTPPTDVISNTTTVIRRTVRSGQTIEYPGHVVVMGDVNPGAKIVAGGHIIVWGKLRGTVQAGAVSPTQAFVCALQLAPMQLAIGSIISRSPVDDTLTQSVPEMAFIQDGKIIAQAWK